MALRYDGATGAGVLDGGRRPAATRGPAPSQLPEAGQLQEAGQDQGAARSQGSDRPGLRRLTLTDYRSYRASDLPLDGRPVVLFGPNGAGKTNLLEAVSMIGPGRGMRSARREELACKSGGGGWAVSARLVVDDEPVQLGVGVEPDAPTRRICRIDGRAASGPSAFSRFLRLLWLTPAQDRLFLDGAGERRRFIDRMAHAHDAAHGRAATVYEKAMRQRQKLLDDGVGDDGWLSALEAQMVQAGVAIAASRRELTARLAAADLGAASGAFPAIDITMEGDLETALGEKAAADVEDAYGDALRRQRPIDQRAGRALMGPHRSDLAAIHRQKGAPARLCSTGEQKALLIGLFLANAQLLAAAPVESGRRAATLMLLDEIAAHLDEDRRKALFDMLGALGFQTFMTGTDRSLFNAWGERAQIFRVADGALQEIQDL